MEPSQQRTHILAEMGRTSVLVSCTRALTGGARLLARASKYCALQSSRSEGCVLMAAFVKLFRISGSSGGMLICCAVYMGSVIFLWARECGAAKQRRANVRVVKENADAVRKCIHFIFQASLDQSSRAAYFHGSCVV